MVCLTHSTPPSPLNHPARLSGCVDLILIRHAESKNNRLYEAIRDKHGDNLSETAFLREEAHLRHPDCGLSELGLRQLEHLQAYEWHDYFLKADAFPKCQVFSSPMQRCLLTAQAVGRSLRSRMTAPVTVHPNLFEEGGCYTSLPDGVAIGLPGATWIDIGQRFPEFVCPEISPRGWYDRSQKEKSADYDARALEVARWIWFMQQDMLRSGHGALVLVTHGNIMSAIISTLFTGNPHAALFIHSNTGHTHIELFSKGDRNMAVCQSANKVTHLLGETSLIGGDHAVDDRWIQQFALRC